MLLHIPHSYLYPSCCYCRVVKTAPSVVSTASPLSFFTTCWPHPFWCCQIFLGLKIKNQITLVFTVSLDESFSPIQLIHCEKLCACLPSTKFPSDYHITYSHNHWANTCFEPSSAIAHAKTGMYFKLV